MDRVITGYDASPPAATALDWAVGQARRHDAELHVLTVVDSGTQSLATDDLLEDRARLRADIDRITDGYPVAHRVEHGDAAARLVEACGGADVLVVGSRGRGPFAERLLGSVSHACLHAAPCPVVVVREQPDQNHGVVLVGVDGSTAGRHALTVAADEARRRGATLQAVHVVHWEHLDAEWAAPSVRELLDCGEHLIAKELAETGVSADAEVIHGYPTDILTRRSRGADLVVVGTRGHSPLATLLLGSTADYCARHAHCPTMIVPKS